ncbi:unnamed protein product [Heligmosomoides polygyrus]|uniref:Reverse transcriptase domain-containing protein n=1 Tax=Heligmosomoides polygyrus TaxID=6339 RepID=A0A183G6W0_HELPZ|nr:unnamed protein product [Heligmosomoides polygyrus]
MLRKHVAVLGCSEQTKDEFWSLLDEKTAEVPSEDMVVVVGDLNGHVDGYSCRFWLWVTQRRCGNAKTHDTVATQHRPLICSLKITPPSCKRVERCGTARIKWWRLKEKEAAVISRIRLPTVTTVDETWKEATDAITRAARLQLGTTKPRRRRVDKQAWLWTDDVREKKMTVSETEAALRTMKSGKATGPDDLPADLWKSKGWCPDEWLTEFFNQVVAEKKVPESWQQSTTIPIWKKKGSPADCASYRPLRFLSHTMKIFERIVDGSTVDAIHAVRLLLENHCEKQKPVHFAFLDLEKAFDRVPREVIWYALRQHGVPEELIEWVRILYSCPIIRVRAPAGTSMEFPISVGVHQGSALSPLLFVVVMDAITRDLQKAAPWTLLYADDVMLACEDKAELERQAQEWCDRLAWFGLKLNVKKTEHLATDVNQLGSIKINGAELSRVTAFKYLGSTVTPDGSLKLEVNARVSAAWSKWRSLTGVLCDKTIPEYLKSKVYRTVVRPVATYGAECWPVTKEIESRLSVMETKMLRWTAGVTRLDRVRNDTIRQSFGVVPIADKLREARLWPRPSR